VKPYDPDVEPVAADWLALDESDRLALVEDYHRRHRIRLPQSRLHAALHVVVENQVAMGEAIVAETFDRLQGDGLTRHEALHAIATVVAEHMAAVLREAPGTTTDPNARYSEQLRKLTATDPGETEQEV
jgi:hypothetical protein